jgi:uncharacterized protein with FMN-binding domain
VVFAQNAAEPAAGIGQARPADTATARPCDAATPSASTAAAAPSATTRYKSGTYTATGSYSSPGGDEQIGVTLTLANDTISRLSVDTSSASGPAEQFQNQFAEGIDALVVGKRLDQVSVSRVSGSSLTSTGFNKAIATIAAHARR